jgi:membrane protein DedA with SNARE-associated domain/membrane-associated phospholipid phosphatase
MQVMLSLNLSYELVLHWLMMHPVIALIVIFVLVYFTALSIIGVVLPDSILMSAVGILVGSEILPLTYTLLVTALSAFLGDITSYWVGYYFKARLHHLWPFNRYPNLFQAGEKFTAKYGGKSIFIGRFAGPMRNIVPLVAGMFNMPLKNFLIADIFASVLWSPCYMLPGLLLGAASSNMPPEVASGLVVYALILLVLLWFTIQLFHYLYRHVHRYLQQWVEHLWVRLKTISSMRWLCYLLQREDDHQTQGQLLAAFFSVLLGLGFFFIFSQVLLSTEFFSSLNSLVFYLLRSMRTSLLDHFFLITTYLGDRNVVLIPVGLLTLFFLYRRCYRAALHLVLGAVFIMSLLAGIKYLIFIERPLGILYPSTSSSFPSGHTSLAIMLYSLIAMVTAQSVSKTIRPYVYWSYAILCLLIMVSRLYFSIHWFSDILGGFCLSFASFLLVKISYQRHTGSVPSAISISAITLFSLMIGVSWQAYHHMKQNLLDTQIYWSPKVLKETTWWSQLGNLPVPRLNRLGEPVEALNIQWMGDFSEIKRTLIKNGWVDLETIKHRYALEPTSSFKTEILKHKTLLIPLFQDQPPVIEMIKIINENTHEAMILHLWFSNIYISPHYIPFWIGTLYYDKVEKHWLLLNHKRYSLSSEDIYRELIPAFTSRAWQLNITSRIVVSEQESEDHLILIKLFEV